MTRRPRSLARRRLPRERGLTLMEIMVAVGVMAMMSILLYGVFDSMARAKKGEAYLVERSRQAREAVARIVREMSASYLSLHNPPNLGNATRITAFIGQNGSPYDRVDFASFAHVRTTRDAKESDQAEIGYFVVRNPDQSDVYDLVRREQSPLDMDPKRGGVVNVLAENVESFDLKYLDPVNGRWVETWDTTQAAAQPNRLPMAVRVTLTLKGVPGGLPSTFTTKFMLPMQQAFAFGGGP